MRDAGAKPLISLSIARKVHHSAAGPVEAVRNLKFSVGAGETVCVVGPSGAGKTTTLRILAGLDRDFEGSVEPSPASITIGVVFQEPRLLPWRTVEANVRLVLPRAQRKRSLDDLFAGLGLTPWRSRYPGELSLGLARRVALARALAIAPSLLILDEPFVSLDDHTAASIRTAVFDAAAQSKASVLMVTHDVREALDVADRLILLTPRPATLLADLALNQPRPDRTRLWAERLRGELAVRYPGVVAA